VAQGDGARATQNALAIILSSEFIALMVKAADQNVKFKL